MAWGMLKRHIGRLTDYMTRIENAESIEEYHQLLSELQTRVDFIDTKNELGQINGRNGSYGAI